MNNIDGNNNNLTLVYTKKRGEKKKDLATNEIDTEIIQIENEKDEQHFTTP